MNGVRVSSRQYIENTIDIQANLFILTRMTAEIQVKTCWLRQTHQLIVYNN